jgi:hypothetical protein
MYWVIADNQERYGPADLQTLQGWVTEGRVLATMQIFDEATQTTRIASQIPGLRFAAISYQGAIAPNMPIGLSHRLGEFPVWAVVLLTIFVPFFALIWLGLMHDQLPKNREDDPSGGKAIGFGFIPFFNIWYWNFVNYPRLVLRINEQRVAAGLPPANLDGLATTMCVLYACFIPLICVPLLGHLLALTTTIIKCVFAANVQSAVNELVQVTQRRGFEVPAMPVNR